MIKTGLANLLHNTDKYENRSIALIANQTSVDTSFEYSWNLLKKKGLNLKKIFSPEHGLFATEQDQDAVISQPGLELPVISLYGSSYETLIPDMAYLDDIDLIIFDIQDIGARYYTYVNTMALFMKAIDKRDIEFIVLDRPNPLGGHKIEGPLLDKKYESFVGIFHAPIRHGMTAGELALMYKDMNGLDIDLNILKMSGWEREMLYCHTKIPWIPPSPNMPDEYTAYLYPGMCLFEGTNVSEGRGTTTPFKNIGAPFIDPYELTELLNSYNLKGITFRPIFFKPTFNKYEDTIVGGIFFHITDKDEFKPFLSGVAVTKAVYDLYKENFEFLKGVYEFNDTHPAFDLLTGSPLIREMIIEGKSLYQISECWHEDESKFIDIKKKYEIY